MLASLGGLDLTLTTNGALSVGRRAAGPARHRLPDSSTTRPSAR
jgi:hypothetical protein